jgi:formylglycine-generating enzyme required for sulfatase activity
MGKYEVTWAEYKPYMRLDRIFKAFNERGIRPVEKSNEVDAVTAPSSLYDPSFTFEAGDDPGQPAATITQFAAKQYTKWLSRISGVFYRLPTEAEWEYACRAGTTTAFYFGDDADQLSEHAWFVDNSEELRHKVGTLKSNPWGLHDMYGNVAEWVLDEYNKHAYRAFEGKSVTAEQAFRKPTRLYPRVVRGGSWELEIEDCRSAARMPSDDEEWKSDDPNVPKSPWWYTDSPALGVGFRLIRPLDVPSREQQEEFWKADLQQIADDAQNRIRDNGRGAIGIADRELPQAIEDLKNDDR